MVKISFGLLFALVFISSFSKAVQGEVNTSVKYRTFNSIGLQYVSWNDRIILQSNGIVSDDSANFVGMQIHFEKHFSLVNWGWAFAASAATGKASAGGNSQLITYQNGNQAWTSYGVYAKVYRLLSPRVFVGLQIPVVSTAVSWASNNPDLAITGGRTVSTGVLLETTFRITPELDFSHAIGFYNTSQNSTLWKMGLSYRL